MAEVDWVESAAESSNTHMGRFKMLAAILQMNFSDHAACEQLGELIGDGAKNIGQTCQGSLLPTPDLLACNAKC